MTARSSDSSIEAIERFFAGRLRNANAQTRRQFRFLPCNRVLALLELEDEFIERLKQAPGGFFTGHRLFEEVALVQQSIQRHVANQPNAGRQLIRFPTKRLGNVAGW